MPQAPEVKIDDEESQGESGGEVFDDEHSDD